MWWVVVVHFNETARTIIDGRTNGFCKFIVDRAHVPRIPGCHVVGERAVEIVQVVAIAVATGMSVSYLARIPLVIPHLCRNPWARGEPRCSTA